MIQETIRNEIKVAMKEKNSSKLNALRSLSAAFTNELVSQRQAPDSPVNDDVALKVIKRAVKQRKDSIAQFEAGGRMDLAENERTELAYIEPFLPHGPSTEEIRAVVLAKKAALGISDKSGIGTLTGAVMKEFGGTADGNEVRAIIAEVLA